PICLACTAVMLRPSRCQIALVAPLQHAPQVVFDLPMAASRPLDQVIHSVVQVFELLGSIALSNGIGMVEYGLHKAPVQHDSWRCAVISASRAMQAPYRQGRCFTAHRESPPRVR